MSMITPKCIARVIHVPPSIISSDRRFIDRCSISICSVNMLGQPAAYSRFIRYQSPSMRQSNSPAEDIPALPQTFISSLRQLFAILDKTNCGHVHLEIFKRYFDGSAPTPDFLSELESESRSNNYYITFNSLLSVISRTLPTAKRPPFIRIPTSARPTDALMPHSQSRSVNEPDTNVYHLRNAALRTSDVSSYQSRELSTIRSSKRFEFERDLLVQTCDTLDHVKSYLADRLLDMKDKRTSYCRHLATAETTGLAPESMYNRDLIADLFKIAYTVLSDAKYDVKRLSERSPSSSSCSSANAVGHQHDKQLRDKDDHIRQLETEKRVLLKELIEMRHQYGTVLPPQIA